MQKSIPIGRKLLAFLLALATILSLVCQIPVSAETLSDGQSSYVTIKLNETHYVLETQGGTKLQGQSWTYTSDTGITGPAYCINWGLAIPSTSTQMPISGRYTATPQTLGAFANGYPQRPLEDFIALNKDAHPILEKLTRIEYVAATQAAVWATLGQLAIDGTQYTSGRDTLKVPTSDPSQLRAYEALMIILYNASFWDRPLLTGMHIRLGWNEAGNTLNIEDESGLAGAEQKGMYGIAKETIGGVEYYTRSFIASSATSTFKNGYTIDLRLENAPAGTILADANGSPLSSYEANGVTYWSVPTPTDTYTNMNQNGSEYAGEFKVCIPVNDAPDSGDITFHASAVITQYDIYFANNSVAREQSFVIADPMYADMACTGSMTWAKVASPHGRLVVNKTDGMGAPLAGATFTLTGADGSTYEGTSDDAGQIVWENLDPAITYTLSETQVPAGYIKAEDVTVTLTAGATTTVSVQNFTENTLRIRKIDAQNGNPLIGATFRIEQIDGSFATEITTNHTGVIELTSAELPYGSYRISEKTAPEGYEPSGEVQTIDWDGAANVTLTFENVREMSFVIVKADAETSIPLGGVAFEVYKDGRLVTTVTTDTAGYATVSGLTEGYYEVKEVAAPEGYILDTAQHGIHLDPYDTATEADPILLITNSRKPSLTIEKLDATTHLPIRNVRFALYKDTTLIGNYSTNIHGTIELNDLEPGTYTVQEIAVPEGYVLQDLPQSIELEAGQTSTLTFFNPTKPGISILKVDAESGEGLENARFRIQGVDSSYLEEFVTDRNGEITLENLAPGVYEVSEIEAPAGYIKCGEVRTFEAKANGNIQLVFANDRKPTLKLTKIDAETGEPLSGATFRIAMVGDSSHYYDRTTDRDGEINIDNLDVGVYTVQEISAPGGYQLDDTLYFVELFAGKESKIAIKNREKPSLTIIKLDSKTMKPLEGAVFDVYRDTALIGTYTTDADGEIRLHDLRTGTYYVKEIAADNGYIVDNTPQQIEIVADSGDTATLVFLNDQKPYIRLVKLDSENFTPLPEAIFEITKTNGGFTGEFTTDANGEINLEKLAPGSYIVREVTAPNGYVADNSERIIDITGNGYAAFVFTNTVKPTLKVTKIDAATGEPLPGAVIRFTNLSGTDVFEMTTDEKGEILLTNLNEGIYTVQEITAPAGYLLDDTLHHVTVVAGENNSLVLENDRKPSLTIKKYDSLTGEMMAGTTFEIYRDTTLVGVHTTDANGEIRLYDLVPGTYTVQEIATDDDHIANSTPQSIEITADSLDTALLVFLNDQKPYIRLVKLDSQTMQPLVNATFTFKKVGSTFEKEYTTDENGEIRLDQLDEGTYTVTEIKAPDGYLIDDAERTVKINGNEYATFVFTDTKKPSLKILKYDKHNDKYLSGATFRIAKIEDGSNYLDRITDIDGCIEIDNLAPGVYSVQEIKAPVGYVLNETEYHVELFPGKESQLVVLNEEKPNLRIVKTDAITGEPIAGVGFLVRLADGSTENTVVTDSNGEALLTHLEPGVYEVIEKSVPNGYLLDSEPKLVTLIPNRTSVVRFENHPKPSLTVNKVDSITKDPLKNARFSVIYASNATFTGEINNLGTYTTDENGQFKLYNLNDGWYKITEIAAPDGYEIAASSQEIYIRGGENKVVTFENVPLSGLVIRKVDADTGEVLQGARFEVRYLSGTSGSGGTVIGEYMTSENGTIVINRLKAGTYVIEEIKAPDGYIISDAPETVYISGTEQDVVTVTFENKRDGGLIIRKLDSVTGEPLAGAEFTVTTSDGKFVGTDGGTVTSNGIYTSDATGQIHITGIEAGTTVVVTETKAPEGYVLDKLSQTVKIDTNDTQTLTFYNHPGTGMIIKKVDADSGVMLSGAKFRVRSLTDGAVIGDFTTGANGTIVIGSLKAGTYSIEETKAPDGYIISDSADTVVITGNEKNAVTVTFENKRDGGLIIRKVDSVTGEPLAGAEFTVTTSDGKFVGTDGGAVTSNGIYTTDATGQIHITGIEAGTTVVVTETKAPDGYVLDELSQTVKIDANDIQTLTFYNHPSSGILITKLDSITEKPLAGAVFEVTDGSGAIVGTANGRFTTDVNGIIKVSELKPGTYVVTEVTAPDGYTVDSQPQTIKVESGKVHNLLFYNDPASGIVITKLDSVMKSPLSGATFEVKRGDGTPIGKYTTDANGMIHVTGLESGTYVVTEISAPDGYTADGEAQIVSVVSGKLQNLTFYNIPDGGIIVNKLDSVTNAPLSGAMFEVTDVTGAAVGRYTTDASGIIRVNGLKPGAYIVKEVAAPDGYTISGESQSVTVVSGKHQSLTLYNAPDSTLVITKLDRITKEPLYGAVFEVTEASGAAVGVTGGRYSTDVNGTIRITGIKPGAYVITEVAAPDGYTISGESQTVEIASGKIYNLTFYNDPAGGLIITKLDRITKEPLYGAVFEVTDSSGAVVGKANGRYVTDANGVIRIRGLKPDTYVITEVEAPDGYIAAPEPQTIKVVPGEIHNLTFYNSPSGALVITKLDKNTGEPLYGATFKVTDSAGTVVGNRNGTYTTNLHGIIYIPELAAETYVVTEILAPDGYTLDGTPQTVKIKPGETHELVFVNEPLGGIRITKLDEETRQPIKGVQYDVSRMNGERIGTFTTNASGVINIDDLPNGWYTAVEVRAADGYILDAQPHDIEVADGEIMRVTLTNRKSSSFFIHKVDAATGKGIYGVTFLVSDRWGTPIAQYVTDQNGYVYMDDRQLEDGKYFIREIGVPNGYVIDPEIKTFYVEYGRTASITWYNLPIQAQIQIVKKSADDNPINGLPAGSLLEGAVFEIYDKAGNVVDTVTTDRNGRASSKPLPLGLYTIRETSAPMYYTANDTVMSAHLEFNGQIMTFEVLNKSVKLGVSVSKYGYNEVMPDNPMVYSFKNIANTSSVPLESFYFRDTLPSAIRAEQLVTGTFNQPLSYKIVYLTNLSNGEYRTINDNLSTSRNYVIDISNVALGLAENEYLTEIMYVFGTVKAGFAQVESPQLYARSVKNLANGASFVNMADVGGIYNGQWITTISRWVTRVYSYTQIEMPKTGY